jgi:hypothetical protein
MIPSMNCDWRAELIKFSPFSVKFHFLVLLLTYFNLFKVARWNIFRPKSGNLGKFWRALQWKMYILRTFGLFYGHLMYFMAIWVYCVVIWYIFPRGGILYRINLANCFFHSAALRYLVGTYNVVQKTSHRFSYQQKFWSFGIVVLDTMQNLTC